MEHFQCQAHPIPWILFPSQLERVWRGPILLGVRSELKSWTLLHCPPAAWECQTSPLSLQLGSAAGAGPPGAGLQPSGLRTGQEGDSRGTVWSHCKCYESAHDKAEERSLTCVERMDAFSLWYFPCHRLLLTGWYLHQIQRIPRWREGCPRARLRP